MKPPRNLEGHSDVKTVVVYVKAPQAGRKISVCASPMGPAQTVTAADCAPALFVELSRRQVEAVLVDMALAVPDPVKFTKTVQTRFPRTGVLLSGTADPRTAVTVAAAGALGVIKALPGDTDDLLVAFAQAIMLARAQLVNTTVPMPHQRSIRRAPTQLSQREFQVLAGITEGKHETEISRELFVSEDTVKTHAKKLCRKLRARDHSVAIAFRTGLVS